MNNSLAAKSEDLQLLQALVVDNEDLEKLESLLGQFNVFEALNITHQELRHSDFLAFLLNPRQSHGLGDVFVKRLLQRSVERSAHLIPVTPLELDLWDLDDIDVRREWLNIDILILVETHRLAVVIENKIYTGEHSDQLQQYFKKVKQYYPGYQFLGLFLTPDGLEPSDSNYIPISYELICKVIDDLCKARGSTIQDDVLTMMKHYTQMLRRHVVNESEIADLCQKIYYKHQRALDLIYEYRPDLQASLHDVLEEMVRQSPDLIVDQSSKTTIRFLPKEWDVPVLRGGQGWTHSGRILLFELYNGPKILKFNLYIGPGPQETRRRLFDMAAHHEPPFKGAFKTLYEKWNSIYRRLLLRGSDYEEKSQEELEAEIREKWSHFLAHDLPAIKSALASESWLSEV